MASAVLPRFTDWFAPRFLVFVCFLNPAHVSKKWENVLIARHSGELYSPSRLLHSSNMEEPTTPKHQRVTHLQLDSTFGRTPSQPTSHYCSSTNITEAKTNLKTVLAPRVSYHDPNIVDVLIKPNEISDKFVETVKKSILKDQVIVDFLAAVRDETVALEIHMYRPLVRRTW